MGEGFYSWEHFTSFITDWVFQQDQETFDKYINRIEELQENNNDD